MTEIWKDVFGYDGKYQVSNIGRVRTLNFRGSGKPKLIKPANGTKGYKQVCLTKNSVKTTKKVHRLVAEAFIPNPLKYPTVNHKDENKENNRVDNLEWCTFGYNTNYGTRAERCGKRVKQFTKDGKYLRTFKTISDAHGETAVGRKHISNCCKHKPHCLTAGGYKWEFE